LSDINKDNENEIDNIKKRPNTNYSLSSSNREIERDDSIVYHYSRERRLENAPKEVQDLYKEKKTSRFGFLGVLIADKPRRLLFIVIILLCIAVFMLSRLGYFDTTHILEGNKIEINGTIFEGSTILVLRKNVKNEKAYTGAVDIAVSVPALPEEENYPVFYHRIFFTKENDEIYRFVVPFDDPELLMVLQNERASLQIKINSK